MNYSTELDKVIEEELQTLIAMKRANNGPFNREFIDKYYEKFLDLKKNAKK
jgi:protein associated with RNAse G/E